MNILYVENHPVFAENVVRHFCRNIGLRGASISSAHKAISDGSFDLLLVDYDWTTAKR